MLINDNNEPQEVMSFKQIDFNELVNSPWEDSELYEVMLNPIILYLFSKFRNDYKLEKIVLLKEFTDDEISTAKKAYDNQIRNLNSGFNKLLSISDDKVIHIRPKGRNKKDVTILPNGLEIPKKSWWINKKNIINKI